jgi:hypothetical protein
MTDRTIMQMEIHPELIRLRRERAERLKFMYAGAGQYQGPALSGCGVGADLMASLFGRAGIGAVTGYCPTCGRFGP